MPGEVDSSVTVQPVGAVKSGSAYLQEVLGDVLAKALSAVARERPKDPIQYVAEYLYHSRKGTIEDFLEERKKESSKANELYGYNSDNADNGITQAASGAAEAGQQAYDDQEAPTNGTATTRSTLPIGEKAEDSAVTTRRRRSRSRNKEQDPSYSSGPSTSSSLTSEEQRRQRREQRRHRSRRRKRTAQSEPTSLPSLRGAGPSTGKSSLGLSSSLSSTQVDTDSPMYTRSLDAINHHIANIRRSRSLTEHRPYQKNDPRRIISMKVPVAALSSDEYRKKRGLKLPPMKQTPRARNGTEETFSADSSIHTIYGKRKPGQLQPITGQDKFDWQKHLRKNKKILKENRIAANLIG